MRVDTINLHHQALKKKPKGLKDNKGMVFVKGKRLAKKGFNEKGNSLRQGYEIFKSQKLDKELADLSGKYQLSNENLQAFVKRILDRMIFDGELLGDLLAPLDLGWKERTRKELALMDDLTPLLHKLAEGRDISGLGAYE